MATNSTIFKNKNNAKKLVEGNKNYVNIFNFSKDQPKIIKYNASKENVKNYIKGNLGNNKLNKLIEIIFNVHLYVRSRKNGDNKLAKNILSLAILLRSKYGSRLNAVLSNTFGRKNNQTPTKIKEKSFMKALSLVSNNKKYKGININKNLTINKVISLSSNKNLSRYNVIISLMHSVVDSLEGNGTIPPPRMPKPAEPVGNNFVNELNKRLQNILLGLKNIKNPTSTPPPQNPTPPTPTPPKGQNERGLNKGKGRAKSLNERINEARTKENFMKLKKEINNLNSELAKNMFFNKNEERRVLNIVEKYNRLLREKFDIGRREPEINLTPL